MLTWLIQNKYVSKKKMGRSCHPISPFFRVNIHVIIQFLLFDLLQVISHPSGN